MKALRGFRFSCCTVGWTFALFLIVCAQVQAESRSTELEWEVLWETEIDGSVRAGPVVDVATDQVFVGTGQWEYYALSLSDGSGEWNFVLNGPAFSNGVVYDDLVLIGSRASAGDVTLWGINKSDGTPQWGQTRFSFIDRPIRRLDSGVLVVGYASVELVCPRNGEPISVIARRDENVAFFYNALLQDTTLYYETWSRGTAPHTLTAWDLARENVEWVIDLPYKGADYITAHGDMLAWAGRALSPRGWVVVVADRHTGEVLHEYRAEGVVRRLKLTDQGLIVLEDRKITMWSHDLTTRIWEVETRFGGYAEPLVVGNTVVVGGFDEDGLMALSLADGSLKARYPLDDREASGYWVSETRDLLVFTEADDYPLPGPRYVRAFRVDPGFWD